MVENIEIHVSIQKMSGGATNNFKVCIFNCDRRSTVEGPLMSVYSSVLLSVILSFFNIKNNPSISAKSTWIFMKFQCYTLGVTIFHPKLYTPGGQPQMDI